MSRYDIFEIRGWTPAELTGEERSLTFNIPTKSISREYSEIPKRFTGVANWPQKTNLLCWCCSCKFDTYPKFIPLDPEKVKGEDECAVKGNFCMWECAALYVTERYANPTRGDLLYLICLFESKFTGYRREKMPLAPEKTEMKEYCGDGGLTEAEWQARAQTISDSRSSALAICRAW